MSSPTLHTPIRLHRNPLTPMAPLLHVLHPMLLKGVALPTLGWLDNGAFTPIDPVTLKSFMDIPVQSWEHDFTVVK